MGLIGLFFRAVRSSSRRGRRHRASVTRTAEIIEISPRQTPARAGEAAVTRTRISETKVIERPATLSGRCYVIDGDTIVVNKTHIRLAGIDAPELNHPWGQTSKWALVGLTKGQTITVELDGSTTYERAVGTCYLPDGRDLSAEMVKMGLAIDWPKFSGGKYRPHEVAGIRKKLWRAHNRQIGRYVPQ